MSLDSHGRETELFGRALDFGSDEQGAFLERECAGDRELAARVLALLARDRESTSSLDRSALERLAPPVSAARFPERIGPYRILGLLGSGGMGLVYRAEQQSPRREVALKVIRSGVASLELVRRFEKEAQVLARLDHHGIARVFDAGVFEGPAGPEPFVAMELVRGEPLLEFVDRLASPRTERIELLARICDAVAHAHDQGIVHRDLKPSNVLVRPDGQPKVLDFGVALILRGDSGAITRQTSAGELVGTLPYMSPEQLDVQPGRVDERSDIYAIGVMAYEVLTGRLPHELGGVSVAAAARLVTESAPPRLGDLDRTLRGDLETIVDKALAKEHAQRYASVRELGEDLRRHLRHEPVRAVPPSRLYYLRRFARRNPALTSSVALAALLLVAGTAVSTWQARKAEDAHRHADEQRTLAALAGARVAAEHDDYAASRRLLDSVDPADRGWVWSWLDASGDGRIATFVAAEPLRAAAFLPDSTEIVTVDAAGTLTRWAPGDAGTRRQLDLGERLAGPAAFDPNGGFVAGVHGPKSDTVTVWDASSGRCVAEVACAGVQATAIAVAPGGRLVAFGGNKSFLWDLSRAEPVSVFSGKANAFAFSSEGARLVTTYNHPRGPPGWFSSLDVAKGKPLGGAFHIVANDTLCVALGSEGLAAVGSNDKRVYLVDPEARRVVAALAGDSGQIPAVAFERRGARMATGSSSGLVRVWDTHERSQLAVLSGARGAVRQVAFSADGSRVLAVAGNELGVWDVTSDPRVLRRHASYVYDLEFIRGGARLVSLSYDGTLCIWDARSLELLGEVGGGAARTTYALAAARDGDLLALARSGSVSIVDGDSLQPLRTFELSGADIARDLSFSRDGSLLVVRSDKRVVLLDVQSGRSRGAWPTRFSTPYSAVEFSHDGRCFAYSEGSQAVVRDAASGDVLARLQGHLGFVEALAFSPDDTLLASGALDHCVRLWEVSSWSARGVLEGHTDRVYALAFSPDGKMLASGSNDTTIRLWSVASGEELALLTGHEDYVFSLAFDPDGSRLASASGDKTVRLWDTRPRRDRWRAGERTRAARDAVRSRMAERLVAGGDPAAAVTAVRADPDIGREERESCIQALLSIARDSPR
ncbi:MAG TPA: protein kinase [Planctomycetota bacterium]|jgi:WD40 repeat protein/serine/threonine protein kinase|nr:protein kinase [Planctomycetota bacterium]